MTTGPGQASLSPARAAGSGGSTGWRAIRLASEASRRDARVDSGRLANCEATITGPAARTIGHYSRVEVQADGPRPILAGVAKATADELRAVWGPFVGPGVFITYAYKLDGEPLSLTPQRTRTGRSPIRSR